MSRVRFEYKTFAANYIGGLGYYSLLVALILWIASFIAKIQQFIINPGIRQLTDSPSSADLHSFSGVASNGVLSGALSYTLVAITVLIALALPYCTGKFLTKMPKYLLYMTGRSLTAHEVYRMKLVVSMLLAGVFIITTYNFSRSAYENTYSLLITSLCLFSMLWFFLQNSLRELWKLKDAAIY